MKYTEFKKGDVVKYRGCVGTVFLLNKFLENILIEFSLKNSFSWNSKNPGIIPKGTIINPDRYYYYPEISLVELISPKEYDYEIY